MIERSHGELCQLILANITPKLLKIGFESDAIDSSVDIMKVFDSFSILELILDIEEQADLSVDLAKMDFGNSLPVSRLADQIIALNP